jgi:hypothetical protein
MAAAIRRWPTFTPSAYVIGCLYVTGLPSHLHRRRCPVIVIIIHPLCKWNFFFPFLYFFPSSFFKLFSSFSF